MNKILMYILAAGVLLGGIDQLSGNKRGYGKCLEEGFMLMGPTALSMVGIDVYKRQERQLPFSR